jgi:prephenate dehydratase
MKLAYRGRPGAFADEAALALAAEGDTSCAVPTLDELFAALAAGGIDRAVVPFENSLAGLVDEVVVRMERQPVVVVAEVRLRIAHVLVGAAGARVEEVRRVRSHPIALAQCGRFFASHPGVERIAASDTASAIASVVELQQRDEAAIGSRRASEICGGNVLAVDLEDTPTNRTRFLLLARG